MKKKEYLSPKIEIIEIELEDVIASSFGSNSFDSDIYEAEPTNYRTTFGSYSEE